MRELARLPIAVVILLCICPTIHPEPIGVMPEIDRPAPAPPQCVRADYVFNAQGAEVVIDIKPSPVADCPLAAENTVADYTVSLEQLLRNLIRGGRTDSGTNTGSSAALTNSEKTPGFYNPELYRTYHEAQLLIPLDVLFSLASGRLFHETIPDPLLRFTARSGIASQPRAVSPAADAQPAAAETAGLREKILQARLPERALLVLAGFGLALLPAVFRRLKTLVRFLLVPHGRKQTVPRLRMNQPVVTPRQIEPLQTESKNTMAKRRKVVVKRDESWRKHPSVPAVNVQSQPGSPEVKTNRNANPKTAKPLSNQKAPANTGPRPLTRQNTNRNGGTTRIYRISPPMGAESVVRTSSDSNPGTSAGQALPVSSGAGVASPGATDPAAQCRRPASEAAAERNMLLAETQAVMSGNFASDRGQLMPEIGPENNWPFPEPDDRDALTDTGIDLNFASRAADPVDVLLAEPRVSFSDLRTGVMLAWLEPRVPALTEAVDWEEERLGEFRGLPFAEISLEELPAESGQRKSH